MSKHTLRIPCREQYAYIEVEFEGTSDEAVAEYERLTRMVAEEGLPTKEWNRFLDDYLSTRKPPHDGLEMWEKMSTSQKYIINEIKKTFKRLKADLLDAE